MCEVWARDDGWEIVVTQREPLIASRIPMTTGTIDANIVTYEILVEAMQAHGYERKGGTGKRFASIACALLPNQLR